MEEWIRSIPKNEKFVQQLQNDQLRERRFDKNRKNARLISLHLLRIWPNDLWVL